MKGAGGRPGNEVDLAAYVIEHGNHVKAFHTSVSLKDAASHFGVSQKTIRRHAKEQKIFIEDGFLHVQNEGENDEKIPF